MTKAKYMIDKVGESQCGAARYTVYKEIANYWTVLQIFESVDKAEECIRMDVKESKFAPMYFDEDGEKI